MRLCASVGVRCWPGDGADADAEPPQAADSACRWTLLRGLAAAVGVACVGDLEAVRSRVLRARAGASAAPSAAVLLPDDARLQAALPSRVVCELGSGRAAAPDCGRGCVDEPCVACGASGCAGEGGNGNFNCRHASYERVQGRWVDTCAACASDPACIVYPRLQVPGVLAVCDGCFHFEGSSRIRLPSAPVADAAPRLLKRYVRRELDRDADVDDATLPGALLRRWLLSPPSSGPPPFLGGFPGERRQQQQPGGEKWRLWIDLPCGCAFAAERVAFRTNL